MEDKIGLDLKINRAASTEDELGALAIGVSQLYETAALRWAGRKLSQHHSTKGDVFTVEVSPWPVEAQAMVPET